MYIIYLIKRKCQHYCKNMCNKKQILQKKSATLVADKDYDKYLRRLSAIPLASKGGTAFPTC